MSYLSSEARAAGKNEFAIPFDRQQLADYLNVERSALSKELGRMRADGLIDFRKNRFGIEEPARGRATDVIDLAIVPLVAFDGMKRVGHGGGYYDRFLAGRDCPKIGLAFSAQRVSGVQTLPHDIPLDLIITEKEILRGENAVINSFFGE